MPAARYVRPTLTAKESRAILLALECEIEARFAANRDEESGERIDTEDDAIDAVVPDMEAARESMRLALGRA